MAFFAIGAYTMGWFGSGFYSTVNDGKGIHVLVSAFASHLPGIHLNFLLVLIVAAIIAAVARRASSACRRCACAATTSRS